MFPAACLAGKKENEDGMTIRKAEDFGRWYQELVVKSEMIDYSDISGDAVPWWSQKSNANVTRCARKELIPSCRALSLVASSRGLPITPV